MSQDALKKMAAEAALGYVETGSVIGVGSGSTVNYFIDVLADNRVNLGGVVAGSKASVERLKQNGFDVIDPNTVSEITVYIDGADQINAHLQMIKGGGGALTGEKIVASLAEQFICIADESKKVDVLGEHPVAVEVIPLARSFVAREIVKLGGDPVYRQGFVTDYGNVILDVHNLEILEPLKLEEQFNNIPGVVTNGIFARNHADILLLACSDGIKVLQ